MKHIDVIAKYLEALSKGYTQDQAEVLAKSWAESMELHPEAITKQEFKEGLRNLENDLKLFFVYLVGGTLVFALFIPLIQKYLGIN